jgi:hypothetical protein
MRVSTHRLMAKSTSTAAAQVPRPAKFTVLHLRAAEKRHLSGDVLACGSWQRAASARMVALGAAARQTPS